MRHAQNLITTAEALQYVFNVSTKSPLRPNTRIELGKIICLRAPRFSTFPRHSATYRPLAGETAGQSFEARDVDLSKYGPTGPKVDRPPRDEEIRAWRAHLRLPNGKLSEPQSLRDILDGRAQDEKGQYSQFVQELAPADPQNGREYSILVYLEKKQMKEQELAQKKNKRQVAIKSKGLELGWSIDGHDLQHRLERLKAFLQKGNKVDVVFGSMRKRGWGSKRKITDEEGKALVERFRKTALEVEGTKVIKDLNGTLLGQANMCFQGPMRKEKEINGGSEEVVDDT